MAPLTSATFRQGDNNIALKVGNMTIQTYEGATPPPIMLVKQSLTMEKQHILAIIMEIQLKKQNLLLQLVELTF